MENIELQKHDFAIIPKPPFELQRGCFIGGGFIRDCFLGKQHADIDMFFEGEGQRKRFKSYNNHLFSNLVHESPNAETYKFDQHTIQLIKKDFISFGDYFEQVDFTICQFVMEGGHFYSTTSAIVDALKGQLVVKSIQEGFELDSLRRAFKYQQKGFKPTFACMVELALKIQAVNDDGIDNKLLRGVSLSPLTEGDEMTWS